jgi:AraC-like DNA-binding protein
MVVWHDAVVRAAGSVRDLLEDPIGSYLAGESFVVWFQPRLAGAFGFGRVKSADLPALRELLLSPVLDRGYDMLCDLGAVEVFDDSAFELLDTALQQGADLLARIRRLTLVRPDGLVGAGLAGLFYDRVKPITEAGLFADRVEALTWLGYAAYARERIEIDDLIAGVHTVPLIVRRVRELLMRDIAGATLEGVSHALGRSGRSLQRQLLEARTSFRDELTRARVRIAESLLVASDDKIEALATQLGFASVSAFTTLFGRVVGETPDEFRRHRR